MRQAILTRVVTLACLGLLVFACKPAPETSTGYIVGVSNDIVPFSNDNKDKINSDVANAAVLIATKLRSEKVKFCSGTIINPGKAGEPFRILTNHHCFAEQGEDGKATRDLIMEACTNTTVYFGFAPAVGSEEERVGCQDGSLRTNFAGDLAVFTLSKNPSSKYRPLVFWEGDPAPTGRKAMIVHYPDVKSELAAPEGSDVKLPTRAVTTEDCQVLGAFDPQEWDLDRTLPFSLRHSCDLIHGSSGSALVDVETKTILGVNWGGIKISYRDGTRTDNVATQVDYIQAFLAEEDGDREALSRVTDQRQKESDALAAQASDGGDAVQERTEAVAEKVSESTSCGSLGSHGSRSAQGFQLILLLALLAPALVWRWGHR